MKSKYPTKSEIDKVVKRMTERLKKAKHVPHSKFTGDNTYKEQLEYDLLKKESDEWYKRMRER